MRGPSCTLLLLLLLLLLPHPASSFAYVGYLPEWRYAGANWRTLAAHLSHLLLFSAEPLPSGALSGLDRLPPPAQLAEARAAAAAAGCQLLVCFGGNGRSSGFSPMVRSSAARARFVKAAVALVRKEQLDGIDINWEYPGYSFGSGYQSDTELEQDYRGLAALARELRAALGASKALTLAYYPDGCVPRAPAGAARAAQPSLTWALLTLTHTRARTPAPPPRRRQEALLVTHGLPKHVDLMHAMTYDAQGAHHAPMSLATGAIAQARAAGLPLAQVTLGLPFYGRSLATGDWTTYEDLVQRHHPLDPAADEVAAPDGGARIAFNGAASIAAKTALAAREGLGGVMVWEAGQDCRQAAVQRDGRTHGVTCPQGAASSLLVAMRRAGPAAGAGGGGAGGGAGGGGSGELEGEGGDL